MALPNVIRDVLDGSRNLRDEDDVGAAGDPAAAAIQPVLLPMTSTTMTRLCDSAVVCSLSIASVRRDRRVEPDRDVRAGDVVVDGLRDADDRKTVLPVEAMRDRQRVFATDGHDAVELRLAEVAEDRLDAALDLVGIGPGRAEDRPAARQDAGDLATAERGEDPFGQALPTVTHRHHLVPAIGRAADDRTDDGIEAGTVTAAGQDPDPHARSR